MKLVRFGKAGAEKPGIVDADGIVRDLSAHATDFAGAALNPRNLAKLKKIDPKSLPAVRKGTRLGSCVARPGNFIAVGLNFADHAAETGAAIPADALTLSQRLEIDGFREMFIGPGTEEANAFLGPREFRTPYVLESVPDPGEAFTPPAATVRSKP